MTNALTLSGQSIDRVGRSQALRLRPTLGVAILATLLMSLPNLLDPMVRHDDFPALFSEPGPFWAKTLNEGRWVNYLWHLRGVVTPAWLNFAVYQLLWASFASAIAVAAIGQRDDKWYATVLALLVVTAHSATAMSLWFNTLMPGLALVALYAVLGIFLSQRAHRTLLPPFVILSFMAYTTYPLLLLAVCLVSTRKRSVADLIGLIALFTLSFAAAVLTVYTINLQVHGIFGVPLADWRNALPAKDVAGLLSNLPFVLDSLRLFVAGTSYNIDVVAIFHLVVLSLSTLVMIRKAPLETLYLYAGILIGLALVAAQNLKLGVIVPPRAFIFAWVFYVVLIVRAAQYLSQSSGFAGRAARNLALLMFACHFLMNVDQYNYYRAWQNETRAIAENIAGAREPVLIKGNVLEMPSAKAAFVQNNEALLHRIRQVANKQAILCEADPESCEKIEAKWASRGTETGVIVEVNAN